MDTKIDWTGKAVTITVDRYELAMLSYALGSFQTLAACPRPEYPGDKATPEDQQLANELEQQLFSTWAKMDEGVSYSEE